CGWQNSNLIVSRSRGGSIPSKCEWSLQSHHTRTVLPASSMLYAIVAACGATIVCRDLSKSGASASTVTCDSLKKRNCSAGKRKMIFASIASSSKPCDQLVRIIGQYPKPTGIVQGQDKMLPRSEGNPAKWSVGL